MVSARPCHERDAVRIDMKTEGDSNMKEFEYTITDELGIHARPAGLLVKKAHGVCQVRYPLITEPKRRRKENHVSDDDGR